MGRKARAHRGDQVSGKYAIVSLVKIKVGAVNLVYIHTKGGFHFSLEVLLSGRREHIFNFNSEVGNR